MIVPSWRRAPRSLPAADDFFFSQRVAQSCRRRSCTRACRSVRKPQGSCIPSCRMRGNAHREPTAFAGAVYEGCTSGVSSATIILLLTSVPKASPSESPTSMANKTPAATSTTIIASGDFSLTGQKNRKNGFRITITGRIEAGPFFGFSRSVVTHLRSSCAARCRRWASAGYDGSCF